MSAEVYEAFEEGALKRSNWKVTGLTLFGLALNLGLIFGMALDQPLYGGQLIAADGNELFYDAELVPAEDANKLVAQFKSNDFFGKDYGNTARLQLIEGHYMITMVVDEQFWTDSQSIDTIISMSWILEADYGRKTKIKLESVSLSGTSKHKDL